MPSAIVAAILLRVWQLPRSTATNGESLKKKALKNPIPSESCSLGHSATFHLHEARFGGVHAWGDDVSIQNQIHIRFGESASLYFPPQRS